MRLDAPLSAALVAACLVTVGCAPRPRAPRGPLARAQDTLAEAHVERTGKASDRATLTAALGEADLVCVGEQHDEVTHHRLQHALFLTLLEQDDRARRPLALGLEMVARDFQPLLDAYSRGELTTAELPRALDWKRRWGFRFGMYAPLLHTAHASGTRLIGLNAPRAITRTVARRGLRALPLTLGL